LQIETQGVFAMSEEQKNPSPQYEIRVSGHLDPGRAEWFGSLALTVEHTAGREAITILSGPIADRAALFGILNRIRDLGLQLISVNPIMLHAQDAVGSDVQQEEGK